MANINQLLEDISIRHACKNVSKYAAVFEKFLGIKLKSVDGLEFTWSKDFQWCSDAIDARRIILRSSERQKPKMFSVEDYGISNCGRYKYKLSFTFKFHPENAV